MATANSPIPSSWLSLAQRMGWSEEVFRTILYQHDRDFRVACPGIIQSFNSTEGTAVIRLTIMENITVITPDGQGGAAPVPNPAPIPLLLDVPIFIYGGGGFSVTVPVTAGDECLVVFGDMCYNAWWTTSGSPIPQSQGGGGSNDKAALQEENRRHDLSDAIAIVGLRSKPRALTAYDTSHIVIRKDDNSIYFKLGSDGVTIEANVAITGGLTVTGTTTLNGNLVVNGTVTANDATLDSILFSTHFHGGVTTGGGDTGPPV